MTANDASVWKWMFEGKDVGALGSGLSFTLSRKATHLSKIRALGLLATIEAFKKALFIMSKLIHV